MNGQPRPQGRIEGGDELRGAARDLVSVVNDAIPRLTSRRDLMPRHFAALGLARCNRLLDGMLLLFENGFRDLEGVLARPILEVKWVSLYSLYGGEDAYEEIRGQYVGELGKLSGEGGLAEARRGLMENWEGPRKRIVVKDLAERVGKLLEASGDPAAGRGTQVQYDLLYRAESLMSSHGGVGAVGGHLIDGGDSLGVARVRHEAEDGTGTIVVGAAHVAMLASQVFETFGIGTGRLDSLWAQLTEDSAHRLVIDDEPAS